MKNLLFLLFVFTLFTAPAAYAAEPPLTDQVVQEGLNYPWDIAFLPNGKMLVTERGGTLKVFASSAPGAPLLRTITINSIQATGEAGLMGIALDRDFKNNGYVYLCASRTHYGEWLNQVLRYQWRDSDNQLLWSRYVVRKGANANNTHNGCSMQMLSDNYLWITMGDASYLPNAQNLSNLNGKVLRFDREGAPAHNNPFARGIYSYGHRNPQGIAVRPDGAVITVEHGPDRNDEINRLGGSNKNYGWACYSGYGERFTTYTGPCEAARKYRNPEWTSGSPTIATASIEFVRSSAWADFQNQAFVTTLKEQDLRRFSYGSGSFVQEQIYLDGKYGRLRGLVLGPDGALYITTSNGGNADRIIRFGPSN